MVLLRKNRFIALMFGALAIPLGLAEEASQEPATPMAQADNEEIEEVVVIGRFYSASQALLQERIDDDSVRDVLDADSISRMGDSTVAASLRRIPGLTLVNDKFVYVRGLGERYSSTTLNGAYIPSPDLTRNVIPLDIFPSSVVSGLSVQKSFSPDITANFAGGNVDIRTAPFPDKGFNFNAELGSGWNSADDGNFFSYNGGKDDRFGSDDGTRALPFGVMAGVNKYQANVTDQAIWDSLKKSLNDTTIPFSQAQQINRNMALALNRDVGVYEDDGGPDFSGKVSIGHTLDVGDDLVVGGQASYGYDRSWRETDIRSSDYGSPSERFSQATESTMNVDITTTAVLGFEFAGDHQVSLNYLKLINTDNRTTVDDFFNENKEKSDEVGFRDYVLRFEEREMDVYQARGTHKIGYRTKEIFGDWLEVIPEAAQLNWFYSESDATTDIPNQVTAHYDTQNDSNGLVLSETVQRNSSAAEFRFTGLEDEVTSYGWDITLPFERDRAAIDVSFGQKIDQKARTYGQREFGIGSLNASASILSGSIDKVFSDNNINDPANEFEFSIRKEGASSYFGAMITDAGFGMIDMTIDDSVRIIGGVRREYYRQAAVPWNIFGYSVSNPQISNDTEALANSVFMDDDTFPSISIIYMGDWLAETFQLRFSWSETTVRPDLREVIDATYLDPLTRESTRGNSSVIPADITNFDVRAEWFFSTGDSFTASFFAKEIDNPIEFYEVPKSDTDAARQIYNAEKTEIMGLELEGNLALGFVAPWAESFFVQGNATFQDAETTAGSQLAQTLSATPTNLIRDASGASDQVINLMLGFDSQDGKHSASLLYNMQGDRLYDAGIAGSPDTYEQPFNSLDLTYFWYPNENLTLKAKVQNLLDEAFELEQGGVVVFSEEPGLGISLNVKYEY